MNRPIQCAKCLYLAKDKISMKCKAFPKEIPIEILDGFFIHTKIHPDQDDKTILFEPFED